MDLDLGQLRALSAAITHGTFEAAAQALHVTPSAVSQRIKGLETATGRVLLVRSKPVAVTASGRVVLRVARQVEALSADAARELEPLSGATATAAEGGPVTLPLAVNADSLATWVLPALAPLAARFCFDIHREDQDHTQTLLRDGTVMAAITTDADPVPGCSSTPLGAMRYRPTAAPGFARRWFPEGATPATLARAPVVVFDRDDDLQYRYLRRRTHRAAHDRDRLPVHHVPSSADFVTAVRLGLGWGLLPDLQIPDGDAADLVDLDPAGALDVALHWQQWKLRTPSLDQVAAALLEAARQQLI